MRILNLSVSIYNVLLRLGTALVRYYWGATYLGFVQSLVVGGVETELFIILRGLIVVVIVIEGCILFVT